jgi:hypothetical protein
MFVWQWSVKGTNDDKTSMNIQKSEKCINRTVGSSHTSVYLFVTNEIVRVSLASARHGSDFGSARYGPVYATGRYGSYRIQRSENILRGGLHSIVIVVYCLLLLQWGETKSLWKSV